MTIHYGPDSEQEPKDPDMVTITMPRQEAERIRDVLPASLIEERKRFDETLYPVRYRWGQVYLGTVDGKEVTMLWTGRKDAIPNTMRTMSRPWSVLSTGETSLFLPEDQVTNVRVGKVVEDTPGNTKNLWFTASTARDGTRRRFDLVITGGRVRWQDERGAVFGWSDLIKPFPVIDA